MLRFLNNESMQDKLMKQNIRIKYLIKTIDKSRLRSKNKERQYFNKTKESIRKNDINSAKTYSMQSAKFRTIAQRQLELKCRLEVISAMANSAIESGEVTQSLTGLIKDVAKVADPINLMQGVEFLENIFDDVCLSTNVMETSLDVNAKYDSNEQAIGSELFNEASELVAQEQVNGIINFLPEPVIGIQEINKRSV